MVKVGPYDIDLIPLNSWGKNLSELARKKRSGFRRIWGKIRERELERCGYRCEICGASGEKGELLCHEKWYYDESGYIQRLIGYEVVCKDCNLILHMGRTRNIEFADRAVAHFQTVTGLGKKELDRAVNRAMAEWQARSIHTWKIDTSSDPLTRGFEKEINDIRPYVRR
jgi:hypothetical protein